MSSPRRRSKSLSRLRPDDGKEGYCQNNDCVEFEVITPEKRASPTAKEKQSVDLEALAKKMVPYEKDERLTPIKEGLTFADCTCTGIEDMYAPSQGFNISYLIEKVAKDEKEGNLFEIEFDELAATTRPSIKSLNTVSDMYPAKNRYKDIKCLDNQRVILKTGKPDSSPKSESAFINANFVHGYKHLNAYICAQAPLPTTTVDFWLMIWQEKVAVVVQLTGFVEKNIDKCFEYFPQLKLKKWKTQYGKLLVKHVGANVTRNWTITAFDLIRAKETRVLYHCLYTDWYDMKIPSYSAFVQFNDLVNKYQATALKHNTKSPAPCPEGPPIIVHCSAGVGRTGTYVAFDICRQKLLDTGLIDVKQCVSEMRKQRMYSVQKPTQYALIYAALMEYALSSEHLASNTAMASKYNDNISTFLKEYQRLTNAKQVTPDHR